MIRVLIKRLRASFRSSAFESDLDDEIRAHIDLLAADYERQGMSPADARLAARRAFGGVEPMKERYRDRRGLRWLDDLRQDVRYAIRGFSRSPGFTLVAVVVVALGVGANTAIFSLFDAVVLKSLPVRQPDELVLASHESQGRTNLPFAAYHFRALRERRDVLVDLAAFRPLPISVTYRGESDLAFGQLASGAYHELLGVRAVLGRTLTPADDAVTDGQPPAVLGYGYWQRRFGGAPDVIGQAIDVNGRRFTIVGITASGFFGTQPGRAIDVTVPLSRQPGVFGLRSLLDDNAQARWLYLVGRLRPGVAREQAQGTLAVVWDRVRTIGVPPGRVPPSQTFRLLDGAQGTNELREQFSLPLRVLMGLVGLVLIIACANLANLLLARAEARRHEMNLRLALGARRGRLVRQLLAESLLLSAIGGAVGVGLAYLASDALVQIMSRGLPLAIVLDLTPNARTLTFTLLTSVAAGLVFGLLPSLRAWQAGLTTAARPLASPTRVSGRWSRRMIAAQVMLSVLLLVEAGLFSRSVAALRDLDPGFSDGDAVLLATVRTRANDTDQVVRLTSLFDQLAPRERNLRARSLTLAMDTPLAGGHSFGQNIAVPGRVPEANEPVVWFNFVGPRFFETMGIPVEGRDFRAADDDRAPAVAVISRSLARRYFPGVNPIGRRVRTQDVEVEIVGVSSDVAYTTLREPPTEMIYLPYRQGRSAQGVGALTIAIRAAADAQETAAALRREVRSLAPDLLIANLTTLEERRDSSLARERVVATISMWFGGLALLLGCVGLYGTMSYAVTRRTSELGVRVALGADATRLVGMVLGESLRPVLIGIAVGLPLAFAAGRVSERLLFGVRGTDPPSYAMAIVALLLAAVAAALVPARRAALVDPIVSLRAE